MKPVAPIHTVELFPNLSAELLTVLRNLSADDWAKPTACDPWTVKDVAAHLLDTAIRRLSFHRDRLPLLPPDSPINNYADLVNFLDRLNADWVKAMQRVGPNLLLDFLELSEQQLTLFFQTLPPDAPAFFSVAWAGEAESRQWFDIAREYTERWLHQQHIREAVGQPLLVSRKFMFPVLDAFMRALPHTYNSVEAAVGVTLSVSITGEAGGDWSLVRQNNTWHLFSGSSPTTAASVRLDQDTAWRLFSKGLSPEAARPHLQIAGDESLGSRILQMVSIMA
jgi:uncharacterized protein (TIGR03083 family)